MINKLIKRKNWVELTQDESKIAELSNHAGISPIIAKTILNRVGENYDSFINMSPDTLHDPYLIHDMDKAVSRIKKAINRGEKIVVYGDYDVDGITSTYMLYDYILSLGAKASYFIPDRMDSGYGLSDSAILSLKDAGNSLIVTVDLGISAIHEAQTCSSLGIDLIITDHHSLQGDSIPECIAVVNPKIESPYPFSHLAGAGVAFKLICALCDCDEEIINRYLPFAAIGTIADLVELTDENRYIAKRGLELLKSTKNVGLKSLFEVSKLDINKVTAANIGYAIGPRLNAAGRISSASISVGLLAETDPAKAVEISMELESENEKRKAAEQEILTEALSIIKKEKSDEKDVIVVANHGWHHGIIGIVSSRITDTFYKPSIVMSIDETTAKASGRSIRGFNLFDALDYHRDLLVKYGGHALAAGLTIENDKIEEFTESINEYANSIITEEISTPTIYLDDTITIPDISLATIRDLCIMEPCGMGNRSPMYAVKELTITSIKHLKDSSHSFVTVVDTNGNTSVMPAFGMQSSVRMFKEGNVVDVAGVLSENIYNSRSMAQFIIKDIRPSSHKFITRDSVGNVYRTVKNSVISGILDTDIDSFEEKVSRSFHSPFGNEKLIICLTILSELGMIEYTITKNNLYIHELSGFFKKTSLEKSGTFVKYSLKSRKQ